MVHNEKENLHHIVMMLSDGKSRVYLIEKFIIESVNEVIPVHRMRFEVLYQKSDAC